MVEIKEESQDKSDTSRNTWVRSIIDGTIAIGGVYRSAGDLCMITSISPLIPGDRHEIHLLGAGGKKYWIPEEELIKDFEQIVKSRSFLKLGAGTADGKILSGQIFSSTTGDKKIKILSCCDQYKSKENQDVVALLVEDVASDEGGRMWIPQSEISSDYVLFNNRSVWQETEDGQIRIGQTYLYKDDFSLVTVVGIDSPSSESLRIDENDTDFHIQLCTVGGDTVWTKETSLRPNRFEQEFILVDKSAKALETDDGEIKIGQKYNFLYNQNNTEVQGHVVDIIKCVYPIPRIKSDPDFCVCVDTGDGEKTWVGDDVLSYQWEKMPEQAGFEK